MAQSKRLFDSKHHWEFIQWRVMSTNDNVWSDWRPFFSDMMRLPSGYALYQMRIYFAKGNTWLTTDSFESPTQGNLQFHI